MRERAKAFLRRAARLVEGALAVVGACTIVYVLCFEVTCVTTSSMAPLLVGREKGPPDWALVARFTAGRLPRRFQVVSFLGEDGVAIAKRAVGLPGETIAIASRTLFIDGRPMAVPEGVGRNRHGYLAAGNLRDSSKPFRIPEGTIFVLGDDTEDSWDSRFTGPLPLGEVRGLVVLRCWPLARFRWLL